MTENDKQILARWRNAEINYQVLQKFDSETPGWLLSDRTPEEVAVIGEQFAAQEALKEIEDPSLKAVVARIHQPMPNVYASDPAWQAAVEDWTAAKKELFQIAAALDPVSVN